MTTPGQSRLMDRWAEGILQTLVEIAPQIRENQHDYQLMADFMLSATMGPVSYTHLVSDKRLVISD